MKEGNKGNISNPIKIKPESGGRENSVGLVNIPSV
jgi:hypothetical protein